MKVEVEGPSEFQGNIFGSINQRRGMIVSSEEEGTGCKIEAEVPLSEMFGYSTVLRSLTQGKAEFTMEFAKYGRVPQSISDDLKAARSFPAVFFFPNFLQGARPCGAPGFPLQFAASRVFNPGKAARFAPSRLSVGRSFALQSPAPSAGF